MTKKLESTLVIDLETKKSFQEVGGRENHSELGVSVAGVYDYINDSFRAYEEAELDELEKLIEERDLVVGFNIKDFDWKVLQPYFKKVILKDVPTLDLIEKVKDVAGFRIALNNLTKHTLGEEKSGHGLEALEWFREGRLEEVKKYCLDDVRLTRDLYEYGKDHGVVRFLSRVEGEKTVPARWFDEKRDGDNIKTILAEALEKKNLVEIDYVSAKPAPGEPARKKRVVEVHSINGKSVETYCHLRDDTRSFRIGRIIKAQIKEGLTHTRPTLF